MKLAATPCDATLRNTIPTTTVDTHTVTPVGSSAVGRRQPRHSSQRGGADGMAVSDRHALGVATPADRAEQQHAGDVDDQRDGGHRAALRRLCRGTHCPAE
jgi:hypothetical protein